MALSGSFTTTGYEGRTLTFSWTATQSIPYNNSTISWTLKGDGREDHWYSLKNTLVVIDGETVYTQPSGSIELRKDTLVASGTKVLTHNTAGSRTFVAAVSASIYTGNVNATGNGTFWLNDIPRAAKLTYTCNFNDTETPIIGYSNPAGTRATLEAAIFRPDAMTAIANYRVVPNNGDSYIFNFTAQEFSNFYAWCGDQNSCVIRFYLRTTLGGTQYLDMQERIFSIAGGKPTLNPTIVDIDPTGPRLTGNNKVLIAGVSDAKVTFNDAAYNGATIVSRWCQNGDMHLTGDGVLYDGSDPEFVFSIRDSRNNVVSKTLRPTVVPYYKPSIAIDDTSPDTSGHFDFTVSGKCFKGSFGTVNNTLSVQYRFKKGNNGWGSWTTMGSPTWNSDGTWSAVAYFNGLDYQTTYYYQARISDQLVTSETPQKSIKTQPVFEWSEDAVDFNVPVHFHKGGDGISGGGGGDYLPITGGTVKGDIRLKRDGSNYGCKLNFGDGEYTYIGEDSDDHMHIKATSLSLDTNNVRIQKPGQNYGGKLNFGDGNYAYIQESPDDTLDIHGTHVKINGNEIKVGTWTPSSPQMNTYTQRYGNYFKIGNLVTITWCMYGHCSQASATFQITGLPFNANTSYKWQAGGGNLTNYTTPPWHSFSGYCIEGGNYIYARTAPTSGYTEIRNGGYCGTQVNQTIYSSGMITYRCA